MTQSCFKSSSEHWVSKALCNLSRSLNDLNGGKTSVVMFIGSCRNIFFETRADAVTESVKYYRLYNSTEVRFTTFSSGGFTKVQLISECHVVILNFPKTNAKI